MPDRLYLTTAIPFVNGSAHLGHALEYVQTDVLARHARARGRAVRFLTGTDEHAAKNVQAALTAGESVPAFVARNAAGFRALADALGVSYDDFLRTSADPRHRPAVEEIWRRCAANGDLYRDSYTGWYCAGCEEFYDPDSLPDGRCAEHDAPLERIEEENWFFRLSRYRESLTELITAGRLRIEPEGRRNEVLGFLSGPVRDISVSRPRDSRARLGHSRAGRSRSDRLRVVRRPDQLHQRARVRRRRRAVSRVVVRRRRTRPRDRQGHRAVPRGHLARDPVLGRSTSAVDAPRARLRDRQRPQDRQVTGQRGRPFRADRALRRGCVAVVVVPRDPSDRRSRLRRSPSRRECRP